MQRLDPSALAAFARRYRFAGGRLRGVRVSAGPAGTAVELRLRVRPAGSGAADAGPVRLKLRLTGVEEFRFQKRPTVRAGRVPDARFGYFGGLFYVTLDAWPLGPGETAKVHDFRASDAFAGAAELWWEEAAAGAAGG